jgi:prepilin-type N-terminal cleavage/methylation domain-containing protein
MYFPIYARISRDRRGFTLTEMLAVLVIVGVSLLVAAPRISGMVAGESARGAVDRLAADIGYARMLAVREGQTARLVLGSATSYSIIVDPSGANRTVKRVDFTDDFPGLQLSPGSGMVSFNSRGLLQTGSLTNVAAARGGISESVQILGIGQTYRE